MLSQKTIDKAIRIDQVVTAYFTANPSVSIVAAKDLMPLFVKNNIFNKDYSRPGLPIRNVLRALDEANKLSLIKHCKVVRNQANRNWYFSKKA